MHGTKNRAQHHYICNNVPIFDRSDFEFGSCLGKGGFSKVYTVDRIRRRSISLNSTKNESSLTLCASSSSLGICTATSLSRSSSRISRRRKEENIMNKYAVKRLRNSTLRKKEQHARAAANDMINEVQLLSLFDHENIVKVYGCSSIPLRMQLPTKSMAPQNQSLERKSLKQMFMIIDQLQYSLLDKIIYWESCHLDDILEQKKTKKQRRKKANHIISTGNNKIKDKCFDLKLDIALQIATAIEYIHDQKYIFRDLKPDNIGFIMKPIPNNDDVYEDEPRSIKYYYLQVKLFDFGLCRKLPKPVIEQSIEKFYKLSFVGTPLYMAPEVHNEKLYNPKVDVYAWSLIFYKMLTLRNPDAPPPTPQKQKQQDQKGMRMRSSKSLENIWGRSNDNNRKEKIKNYTNTTTAAAESDELFSLKNGDRPKFDYNDHFYSVPKELQIIMINSWKHKISERYSISKVIEELKQYYYNQKQRMQSNQQEQQHQQQLHCLQRLDSDEVYDEMRFHNMQRYFRSSHMY